MTAATIFGCLSLLQRECKFFAPLDFTEMVNVGIQHPSLRHAKRENIRCWWPKISVQTRENSLLRCVGNSRKQLRLPGRTAARTGDSGRFPRKFPADSLFIREFGSEQSSILTAHTAILSTPQNFGAAHKTWRFLPFLSLECGPGDGFQPDRLLRRSRGVLRSLVSRSAFFHRWILHFHRRIS